MVKVEIEGKVSEYRVKCSHCLSVLKYNKSDIKYSLENHGNFNFEEKFYIVCPLCESKILIRSV